MVLKKGLWMQSKRRSIAGILVVLAGMVLLSVMPMNVQAESALRSRVYGFRNTDNQRAVQLVNQLGIKVTMDVHSPSVVVLTSDDSAELSRAYNLMEMLDRKEPVEMKVLAQIPEQESKTLLNQLQGKLKKLLPGTLLDPPAKGGSTKPVIIDVYKGQLLAMAPAAEMAQVEAAWQSQQTESPTISTTQAAVVPTEPVKAAEPNQPVKVPVVPVSHSAEPNEAMPEPQPSDNQMPQTENQESEDDESDLAVTPIPMAGKSSLVAIDANDLEPEEGEDDAALKKIVEQLMKQAAEEEKKAAEAEAAAVKSQQPEPSKQPESAPKKIETAVPDKAADTKVDTAATTPPAISKEEEELELTITLPEKVDIRQLLELVGKQLGLNYMYDDAQVRGEVMLKIHDGKIKVRDCYALLESVLRYRGFVMTRRGNLVTILPVAQLPQLGDPKIRKENEPIEHGDVIVSSVFELKHINVNNANNILRQMNLGVTNPPPILIAETNTMIITDYAYRMDKIAEVLRLIDVPGTPKKFMHRQLQYMQAGELIPRLQKLASQLQNLNITVGTSTAPTVSAARPVVVPGQPTQPGQPVQPVAPQPVPQAVTTSGSSENTVYLDADERTNRILMIGNNEQLKMVEGLIDSLDVKQYNLRRVREYEIKNVDAAEVINVLNELGLAKVSVSKQSSQQPTGISRPTVPGQPVQQVVPQTATQQATTGADQPFISIRPNTNSLLVNATAEQHEDIELVIKHIDVEQKDQRTIREYEIQNVDAMEIVSTLGDLGIISKDSVSSITSSKGSMYGSSSASRTSSPYGTTSTSRSIPGQMTQPGVQQPGQEQTAFLSLPTAEGGTVRELVTSEPQISILESTNSLLIHATPRQHAAVSLVISHVDRILEQVTTPYVVYQLENQKPDELVATLEDLISETQERAVRTTATSSPDAKIQTAQASSSSPTLPNLQGERIRIIADKASNSLIVYANKKNQLWISELIKELDAYRPQVLLDCTLVEITKDDQFTMDLDVISKKYGLTTPFKQLTNPITGTKAVTNTGGTALEGTFSSGSETNPFTAFYGDNNIQALLTLMDKKNYGRVLARPSILVKDNEEGVIKSEKVTYVAEQKSSVITGEGGQLSESTDVSFKDYTAGITLTITPHISSEKIMQLEIELDRTDFIPGATTTKIGTTEYPKPLDTTSSNVKTWSIVPSGATIILGGIETVTQNKTNTKIPILGDIPLVGLLFRGINQSDNQSKLYIFVKANIVKPGDELTGMSDIERISRKKRKAFEEDESRFQGLDALPGFKPNPMYPGKVLEDDEYIEDLKQKQANSPSNTVTVEVR